MILIHHFYSTELFALEAIFSFIHRFFLKYLNLWVFLSVLHLVDNYAKIVDERARNLMCDGTLQSLLVSTKGKFDIFLCQKTTFLGYDFNADAIELLKTAGLKTNHSFLAIFCCKNMLQTK